MTTETHIDLILAALGPDATRALVAAHGGQRHRIPKKAPGWLVDSIGREAAEHLCRLYADTHLTVPMAAEWQRAERDNAIRADYDAGASVHQLVTQYKLHESTVRRILNRADEPSPAARPRIGGLAHLRDSATIDLFSSEATP